MGIVGPAPSSSSVGSTAWMSPPFSRRANAGYSDPNETLDHGPSSSASCFFSS
jgi:hypothetical protein